jgi:hypothetical protein
MCSSYTVVVDAQRSIRPSVSVTARSAVSTCTTSVATTLTAGGSRPTDQACADFNVAETAVDRSDLAAMATPLFAAGFVLGFILVSRSTQWFLGINSSFTVTVDLVGYFDFVASVMLLFGAAFEFPLLVVMLNFAGLITAKRLLGWWRIAIFLMFLFAALVTPTPDPFNMTVLAPSMAVLYFAAVGVAFLNDRRRSRRNTYNQVADDEASLLEPVSPVDTPHVGRHRAEP